MTFHENDFLCFHEQTSSCRVRNASIRKFGLRSLFHYAIDISMGSSQVWINMVKEEGLFCICQTIAKSSFFFSFIQVSLLVEGCDSELREVCAIIPKVVEVGAVTGQNTVTADVKSTEVEYY